MNKHDFKKVRGVALVGNLSFALFLCFISSIVFWLWKSSIEIMFISMIGFAGLYLISGILIIFAGNRLKEIKFQDKTNKIVETAIRQSRWVIFTIPFTISINRIRSCMWEEHIDESMRDIKSPIKRVKLSQAFLEELKEDGFISEKEYTKRKENLKEALISAKQFEKDSPDNYNIKDIKLYDSSKRKTHIKEKNEREDNEPWI